MLRKTKPTNILKAITVIVLLSSSLFAIQVQAQQNQQQQQQPSDLISPQGNQTMTSNQTMAIHDQMRLLWDDQAVYTRLVLVAFQANMTGDFNASFTRLMKNAELIGNASQHLLGQAASMNLTMLIQEHDQIYEQILNQSRYNNTQALNNSLTMWYENAANIAVLFNVTMPSALPGSNQTIPEGNQSMPSGNQSVPSGNQSQPAGNQSMMAVIWIVNGAAANMSSLGYNPASATVTIGVNNTITWINNDTSPQTVTSVSAQSIGQSFDSGPIQPQQNFTYTFTVPGTYEYYSTLHPWMLGNITVLSNQTMPSGNQSIHGGNQTQQMPLNTRVLTVLNMYLDLTWSEVKDYMDGNYSSSIVDFDQSKSEALNIAGLISSAIIAITPTTGIPGSTNTTTTTTNATTTMTNTTTTTTTTTTTLTNVTTTVLVWIVSDAGSNTSSPGYSPDNITLVIGVNDTVTWINDDNVIHTVVSSDVSPGAISFDSGYIEPGQTFTQSFSVTGTYHYQCIIHPWMHGTIIVKGP